MSKVINTIFSVLYGTIVYIVSSSYSTSLFGHVGGEFVGIIIGVLTVMVCFNEIRNRSTTVYRSLMFGFRLGCILAILLVVVSFFIGIAGGVTEIDMAKRGAKISGDSVAMGTVFIGFVWMLSGWMMTICVPGLMTSWMLHRMFDPVEVTIVANYNAPAIPLKKCPRCAEMIQPDAIVCRFCGNDEV